MQCTFLQSTIYSELGKYLFHGPFQDLENIKSCCFFERIIKSKNSLVECCIVVIVKSIRVVLLGTKENTATRFINSHSLGGEWWKQTISNNLGEGFLFC